MTQVMVHYSAKHLPRKKQSRLSQELYGYLDQSKHSQYQYRREGFLEGIPHTRLRPGCLLLDKKDQKKVLTFFKKRNVPAAYFLIKD